MNVIHTRKAAWITCFIGTAVLYLFVFHNSSISVEITQNSTYLDEHKSTTTDISLKKSDIIYNHRINTVPLVIKEYNLIFFNEAKVASSEWMRFFMRLENNPMWCSTKCIHDSSQNGMMYLSDYKIEEADRMMKDPKWTKAIFVRHPKPRLLSAFLDKFVQHKVHFTQYECTVYAKNSNTTVDVCADAVHRKDFSFFLKEITTKLPSNVHWRSIMSSVDEKWWPYIHEIFVMEDDLSTTAKRFLESIKSNIDGVSAWDRIGKSGWGNEKECENPGNETFMEQKPSYHHTEANEKLRQYYTPELELFVEQHYEDDLHSKYFTFKPTQIFTADQK